MREEFQTEQFPKVILTVNRSDLKLPAPGQTTSGDAPAELTLHGITKPVKIKYAASGSPKGYDVTASTSLNYTDYLGRKITRFGISVQPPVNVEIHAELAGT
jgi:polyisoprenoid-binding protein YceI